jgi:hypothetical protein
VNRKKQVSVFNYKPFTARYIKRRHWGKKIKGMAHLADKGK